MNIIEKLEITPGPWDTNLDDYHDLCIYDSNGNWLANLNDKKENALLLAAAPEMLFWIIGMLQSRDKNDMEKGSKLLDLGDELIQKATEKSWKEIKELLNDSR